MDADEYLTEFCEVGDSVYFLENNEQVIIMHYLANSVDAGNVIAMINYVKPFPDIAGKWKQSERVLI